MLREISVLIGHRRLAGYERELLQNSYFLRKKAAYGGMGV